MDGAPDGRGAPPDGRSAALASSRAEARQGRLLPPERAAARSAAPGGAQGSPPAAGPRDSPANAPCECAGASRPPLLLPAARRLASPLLKSSRMVGARPGRCTGPVRIGRVPPREHRSRIVPALAREVWGRLAAGPGVAALAACRIALSAAFASLLAPHTRSGCISSLRGRDAGAAQTVTRHGRPLLGGQPAPGAWAVLAGADEVSWPVLRLLAPSVFAVNWHCRRLAAGGQLAALRILRRRCAVSPPFHRSIPRTAQSFCHRGLPWGLHRFIYTRSDAQIYTGHST